MKYMIYPHTDPPVLNSTASLIGKDINVSVTSQGMQQNQSQIALA